jgi:cytochrome P450
MEVIAEILGVPSADMNQFKLWSDDMSARFGPLPLERQVECARSEVEFQHYFAAKLEDRRHHPQTDLLTDLLNARLKREAPLDMPEMLSRICGSRRVRHSSTIRIFSCAALSTSTSSGT